MNLKTVTEFNKARNEMFNTITSILPERLKHIEVQDIEIEIFTGYSWIYEYSRLQIFSKVKITEQYVNIRKIGDVTIAYRSKQNGQLLVIILATDRDVKYKAPNSNWKVKSNI